MTAPNMIARTNVTITREEKCHLGGPYRIQIFHEAAANGAKAEGWCNESDR